MLEWHREKARSIEALHDVLKNDLATEVMPCGRFGANAAWLPMALLTHNVLTVLKRIALKPEWLNARPKRLRFHFFARQADWPSAAAGGAGGEASVGAGRVSRGVASVVDPPVRGELTDGLTEPL